MVEETGRIPLAVRWPRAARAGAASDALVTHMDLVPTLLEAAGVTDRPPMDGRSLLPLVRTGVQDLAWREDLLCQHHGHGHECFQRMLRHGPYKYVAHLDDCDELYDLERDPYELRNRIDDPAMADRLVQLRDRLHRSMAACDDNAPNAMRLVRET